jgi:hypothetical protein
MRINLNLYIQQSTVVVQAHSKITKASYSQIPKDSDDGVKHSELPGSGKWKNVAFSSF